MDRLSFKQYFSAVITVLLSYNFVIALALNINCFMYLLCGLINCILLPIYVCRNRRLDIDNKFVNIILQLKYIFMTVFIIAISAKLINILYANDFNVYLIAFVISLCCIYCSEKGSAFVVPRFIYVFLIFCFLIMLYYSFPKFDQGSFNLSLNVKDLNFISISLLFEIPILLLNYSNFKIKKSNVIAPVIISGVIISLIVLFSDCFEYIDIINNSSVEYVLSLSSYGSFIQNLTGIIFSSVIFSLMSTVSMYMTFNKQCKYKKTFYIAIVLLSLIVLLFQNLFKYLLYLNAVLGFVIIVLSFVGSKRNE